MTRAPRPCLAFSTLGCPEWAAGEVVRHAAAMGWDGIEWRGGSDGTVAPGRASARPGPLRRAMDDAGLRSIAVTTYPTLISPDSTLTRDSIADVIAHAELAAELGAPVVRVFLGSSGDGASAATVVGRAVDALGDLLERIRPLPVALAVEPHDEHVRASSIRPILAALPDPRLQVVWDVGNAWSVGEHPAETFGVFEARIAYVQVKDGTGQGASWRLCELGAGEVPLDDALARLAGAAGRAAGSASAPPISLEWERAWHGHLAPAATALPAARAWLGEHLEPFFGPFTPDGAAT